MELAKETFMIWKSTCELENEFEEQLAGVLYELRGVRPELCTGIAMVNYQKKGGVGLGHVKSGEWGG